jgi:hypothetical protein
MVLTIRDMETLASAGKSLAIEEILHGYAQHLVSQPRDVTGSFSSVVRHSFGQMINWESSVTFRKHQEVLQDLMTRFGAGEDDEEATDLHL